MTYSFSNLALWLCICLGASAIAMEPTPVPQREPGLDLERRLVTSDNLSVGGGHVANGGSIVILPGMPTPLDPDGVVSLVDASAGVFCSGALIGDRHILTAAHCLDAASIYTPSYISFSTTAGLSAGPIADIFLHPFYDGTLENGYEVAVVELAMDAPLDAPRYGLYAGTDELGQLSVKAGHGRTGHGSTGTTSFDTLRRVGLNTYEATSTDFNTAFGNSMRADAYLLYDFDSGLSANNAWSQKGVTSDLGYGVDEVNAVSGDSGGPTFLHNGTGWLIGGVTSWGIGLDLDPPDVTPGITDGSWGEISADSRVSTYVDFIQSVVDGTFVRPKQFAYSQGNMDSLTTWDRPNEDGSELSEVGPVPYHAYSYRVDSSGVYDLESTQNFDAVVHLYEGVPNPVSPLVGLLAGNNDGPDGSGTSILADKTLTAGVVYTLVTSANNPLDVGTFLNTITGPGQVTPVVGAGGFSGSFATDHWDYETDHTESPVQTDAAPESITIFGGDTGTGGNTDYTITILQNGVALSFDWTYFSRDDAGFDVFSALVNDEPMRLTDGVDLSGSYSVILDAGDEFGFRIHTVDGVKGGGIANIYAFDVSIPGDYNDDGFVDGSDFTVWRDQFGAPAGSLPNDTDGGEIGSAQYETWKANYAVSLAQPPQTEVVPEPSLGWWLVCWLGMGTRRIVRRGPA